MIRNSIVLIFICVCLAAYGQQKKAILVFDLVNGTVDSIPVVAYDTTALSDHTNYATGCYNSNTVLLELDPPTTNIYPSSNFTYKKRASLDFDLTEYPVRTSMKIFKIVDGSTKNLCSGSLISRKHVLTAAHCLADINSNELRYDSMKVSPVYDNGRYSTEFNSSYVSKAYFFRDWGLLTDDLAVLELAEPIGETVGWVSIGFNEVDSLLLDGVFYKFSYPAVTMLAVDSNEYNGDTLYYNYGSVTMATSGSLSVPNAVGIRGESGSSLIKVVNEQEYTSYGVLSHSSGLSHSRINSWQYYMLKNIIRDDLVQVLESSDMMYIYPNPVGSTLYLKNKNNTKLLEVRLLDNVGKVVKEINSDDMSSGVDLSSVVSGLYYLTVTTDQHVVTLRIMKE